VRGDIEKAVAGIGSSVFEIKERKKKKKKRKG